MMSREFQNAALIRKAYETVEFLFDLPLHLSEKMYLKKYITEFAEDFRGKAPFGAMTQGILKFLMVHYKFEDTRRLKEVIYSNEPNDSLNHKLHQNRM